MYNTNLRHNGGAKTLLAVVCLGALAYFHYSKEGKIDELKNKYIVAEPKKDSPVVKEVKKEPVSILVKQNIKAYSDENRSNVVGVVEAGTTLPILYIKKNNNSISMIQTRTNGLSVWVGYGQQVELKY